MPTSFTVTTRRRGFYDVTARVQRAVSDSGVRDGLCTVFVHHTSASVIVCENADPAVQHDLQRFFDDLAPDGDPRFTHRRGAGRHVGARADGAHAGVAVTPRC